MTARNRTMEQHTNCCYASAAAYTSARISSILDTALLLAVSISIFLLPLRGKGCRLLPEMLQDALFIGKGQIPHGIGLPALVLLTDPPEDTRLQRPALMGHTAV